MDFEEDMPIGMADEKYAEDRFQLLMQASESEKRKSFYFSLHPGPDFTSGVVDPQKHRRAEIRSHKGVKLSYVT